MYESRPDAASRSWKRPASNPHGPEDLFATVFYLLGIDPREEFHTPDGRPVPIVNNGKVIDDLL